MIATLPGTRPDLIPVPTRGIPEMRTGAAPGALRSTIDARFSPTVSGTARVHLASTSGLELRGPFVPAAGSALPRYFLRNVTAGMLEGDDYVVTLRVESGATVAVHPTSASRVFVASSDRSHGSRLLTSIEVEPDAILDFDAGLTIPNAGAIGELCTEVVLHPGATLTLSDALAFGRLARGERFAFRRLTTELMVRTPEGAPVFHRRSVIDPSRDLETLEMAVGGAGALASLTMFGRGAPPALATIPGAYAGISALPPLGGAPPGFSALALAARPEQAIAALVPARDEWVRRALNRLTEGAHR